MAQGGMGPDRIHWWEKLVDRCSVTGIEALRIGRKTIEAILAVQEERNRLWSENRKLRRQLRNHDL